MAGSESPLTHRRRLRNELRAARVETGLTQEQAAAAMEWSLSKMNRIEKAKTGISATDLRALLPLYNITGRDRTEELLALARASRQPGWWQAYADVAPSTLLQLIDYETAATIIRQFEPMVVPGILQTDGYARSVLGASYGAGPPVERLVDLRARRRGLLVGGGAPTFAFVLDESVIRRLAGGPSIMADQLRHLVSLAGRPNVTIQVVPFAAGSHPGTRGAVKIIEFDGDPDESVAFLEGLPGDVITDDPAEVSAYSGIFTRVAQAALGPADSAVFLREAAGEMV
jgi:transcriptional regulator with XRE-family HTH domain